MRDFKQCSSKMISKVIYTFNILNTDFENLKVKNMLAFKFSYSRNSEIKCFSWDKRNTLQKHDYVYTLVWKIDTLQSISDLTKRTADTDLMKKLNIT